MDPTNRDYRELLRNKEDEVELLKQRLGEVETERDQYLNRCQLLEQQLNDEESRFYQQQLATDGRPTMASSRNDRIQTRLHREMQDSQLNALFSQMDQTDGDVLSFIGQTSTMAENLDRHAKNLDSHHSNIIALYEQLKHTAKVLVDIVHALGLENSQVELLMEQISALQLNLEETNNVSKQLASEAQQLVTEMTAMSTAIDRSIRAFNESSMNAGGGGAAKPGKEAEYQQKLEELTAEKDEFLQKCQELEAKCEEYRNQVEALNDAKRELVEKYDGALNLAKERDDELKNRENIIRELNELLASKPNLPDGFDKEVESHLRGIYNTLSTVKQTLHKKVRAQS